MNVSVLIHGDSDGICAGDIVLSVNLKSELLFTNPYRLLGDLNLINYSNSRIMRDIALPETCVTKVLERFSEIADVGELTYINHHPLPRHDLKGRDTRNVYPQDFIFNI